MASLKRFKVTWDMNSGPWADYVNHMLEYIAGACDKKAEQARKESEENEERAITACDFDDIAKMAREMKVKLGQRVQEDETAWN
jgi:hypothetical protein